MEQNEKFFVEESIEMLISIKITNVSFLTMYDIMIKILLLLLPFYHIIIILYTTGQTIISQLSTEAW